MPARTAGTERLETNPQAPTRPTIGTAPFEGPAGQPLSRLRDRLRDEQPKKELDAAPFPAPREDRSPREAATKHDARPVSAPSINLLLSDDLVDAPSIGPKTASRFAAIGITTVQAFLEAEPDTTATLIATRHITASTIVEWQHQARLASTLPGIRGGHAQLLVGAGLTSIDAIAATAPADVAAAVLKFAQTSAGQSILRDGQPPDIEKIHNWVQNAIAASRAA